MNGPTRQSDQPSLVTCPHCGSREIIAALKLAQHVEVGNVGIRFEATQRFLGTCLTGNEPLLADLCQSCGTVVRMYVACTDRRWVES